MKQTETEQVDPGSFELPERIRTRRGHGLLRVPDILRINGRLFITARYGVKIRKVVAQALIARAEEITRDAMFGKLEPAVPQTLTYARFNADMAALGMTRRMP